MGGFGVCFTDDLLRIDDVQLVKQSCTAVSVEFDDASVADFLDRQVDAGRRPQQCMRHWIHTHPGHCARPSTIDEATFGRVFGRSDWATMFILAEEGQTYARLQFNIGPGGACEPAVEIDCSHPFPGSDRDAWDQEYLANVLVADWMWEPQPAPQSGAPCEVPESWYDAWHAYADDQFMEMFADG